MTDIITITQPINVEVTQTQNTVEITSDKIVNITTNSRWGEVTGDLEDQEDLQTLLDSINNSIANAITLLNAAIASKQDLLNYIPERITNKGLPNGYASLDVDGKIPQSQLDIAQQVNSNWDSESGVSEILNKPALAQVATTGSYSDLSNRPSIPSISGLLVGSNNLSDLSNKATARNNLELGTLATQGGTFSGQSSGVNTGDLALGANTNGLSLINQTLDLQEAGTATTGALTSADWNTFNDKEPAINLGATTQYWRGDKSWQILDKSAVSLTNVPNIDSTNPANITQSINYRFVTDTEKTIWNTKQTALGYTPENSSNKSISISLGTSDTLYPSQNAVKSYVDSGLSIKADISSIPSTTSQLTNDNGFLVNSSNLSDLGNNATARTNLGLGSLCTQNGTFSGASSGTNTGDETNISILSKIGFAPFNKAGDTLTATNGTGIIGLPAQSSTPATPSSGFNLFANSSNALSWKGQNGFTRTFDGTSNTANRVYNLPDLSGTVAITAGSTGQIQFNNAGNLNADSNLFWDNTNKRLGINNSSPTAKLDIVNNFASQVPLSVKGAASQSSNLTEWQNSSGTVLARVLSTGDILSSGKVCFSSFNNSISRNGADGGTQIMCASPYFKFVDASNNLLFGLQTDQILRINNKTVINGRGTVYRSHISESHYSNGESYRPSTDQTAFANFSFYGADVYTNNKGSALTINNRASVYIDSFPSTNINSTYPLLGNKWSLWIADGDQYIQGGNLKIGGSANSASRLDIEANSTTDVTVVIKAIASQTAPLLEVRNSSGVSKTGITKDFELQTSAGSGAPGTTPADGAMYVDTTNHRLYVRSDGTWKYTTLI